MGFVDSLSVVVTANSKQFTAAMNGVINKTEQTQNLFTRFTSASVKATAQFGKAMAAATIVAAAFGGAVAKIGAELERYGSEVPAETVKAFDKMNEATENLGKSLTLALGNAMASSAEGFTQLTKKISDTVTNSTALRKLTEGLSYVFAILGDTIVSVAEILDTIVIGFDVMFKTIKMASLAMDDFFSGTDENAAAIEGLREEITSLGDQAEKNLRNAFDFERFIKSVEKVYADQKRLEEERQKQLDDGAKRELSRAALLEQAMRKRVKARNEEMEKAYTQTQLFKKLLTDEAQFGYEVEAERLRVQQENAEKSLQIALKQATSRLRYEQMVKDGVFAIQEQEMAEQARMQALWESGWKGKMEILGGVIGGFAVLMETNSKRMFKIGKAAAIADAIINALLAANKAYQAMAGIPYVGPALGAAAAASALLAGYANVNKIRAIQFGSGSGGGGTGSATPTTPPLAETANGQMGPSSVTNVNVTLAGERFSRNQVRGLLGEIGEQLGDNVRLRTQAGRV